MKGNGCKRDTKKSVGKMTDGVELAGKRMKRLLRKHEAAALPQYLLPITFYLLLSKNPEQI